MSVQVYGCNHVAIEVDDVEKAVAFYEDVFNLKRLSEGEGDAFFKLGEHQFLGNQTGPSGFNRRRVRDTRSLHLNERLGLGGGSCVELSCTAHR